MRRAIRIATIATACAAFATPFATPALSAPRYGLGDIGTFGLPATETWNFHQPIATLGAAGDEFTARFTAIENIGVDRVFQRFVGVDPGTTVTTRLVKDNGFC